MSRIAAFALLLLSVSCWTVHGAAQAQYQLQAARSQQGAYLGCYQTYGLDLEWASAAQLGSWSSTKCRAFCRYSNMPVYALTRTFQCVCSSAVPLPENRVDDLRCENLQSTDASNVVAPLFYINEDESKGCRATRLDASPRTFEPAYNAQNAVWSADGRSVDLNMYGKDGVRIMAKDTQLYGIYSFAAKVSGASGVITAAYMRDIREDPATGFSEIDFEFLNGNPVTEPGTVWLHSYHKGMSQKEWSFPPSVYKRLVNTSSSSADAFHTYTVDWQPGYVTWYMDGIMLKKETYGASFTTPRVPLYFMMSIWCDWTRNFQFGGQLDYSKSPFKSQLTNITQVLCDQPLGSYNGPNWAYPDLTPKASPQTDLSAGKVVFASVDSKATGGRSPSPKPSSPSPKPSSPSPKPSSPSPSPKPSSPRPKPSSPSPSPKPSSPSPKPSSSSTSPKPSSPSPKPSSSSTSPKPGSSPSPSPKPSSPSPKPASSPSPSRGLLAAPDQ